MKWLKGWLCCTIFSLSTYCPAQTNQPAPQLRVKDIFDIYLKFRDGSPPNIEKFAADFQNYRVSLTAFRSLQSQLSESSKNANCTRFIETTDGIFKELTSLMNTLYWQPGQSAEMGLERRARLQVLLSLAGVMYHQVEYQQEAGFGVLDRGQRKTCAGPQRAEWHQHYQQLLRTANDSALDLLGMPGLKTMIQTEQTLGRAISTKERHDQNTFYWTMGANLVGWVMVWELMPFVGGSIFPFLSASKWGRLGSRVVGLSGEIAATNYMTDHWIFPEDRILRQQTQGLSWSDLMASAQALMDSPLESPRIYYDSLTRFYGAWNLRMFEILSPWQDLLLSAEQVWGSIDRAAEANSEELIENPPSHVNARANSEVQQIFRLLLGRARQADSSNRELIEYLQNLIVAGYGYDTKCDRSLFNSISEWSCIVGLRKFLSLLESKQIPSNPSILGVTSLTIRADRNWRSDSENWQRLDLQVPVASPGSDWARFLNYHLTQPLRNLQRQVMQEVLPQIHALSNKMRINIVIEPEVTSEELSQLNSAFELLLSEAPPGLLRQHRGESTLWELRASHSRIPLRPLTMELQSSVDVRRASVRIFEDLQQDARAFDPNLQLDSFNPNFRYHSRIRRFLQNKQEFDALSAQFTRTWPYADIECQTVIHFCSDGLSRFLEAVHRVQGSEFLPLDRIILRRRGGLMASANWRWPEEDADSGATFEMNYNIDMRTLISTLRREVQKVPPPSQDSPFLTTARNQGAHP